MADAEALDVNGFDYIDGDGGGKAVAFLHDNEVVTTANGPIWIDKHNTLPSLIVLSNSAKDAREDNGYFIDVKSIKKIGTTTYSDPSTNDREVIIRRLTAFFDEASASNTGGGGGGQTVTGTGIAFIKYPLQYDGVYCQWRVGTGANDTVIVNARDGYKESALGADYDNRKSLTYTAQ